MSKHKHGRICATFLVLIMLLSINADAQNLSKGLVFSEVYMDKDNYKNNWFEVYNPTDKPLVLNMFSLSYVRSANLLPNQTNEIGGISIKPDECLVICTDKKQFKANWGNVSSLVEIRALKHIADGGFVTLATKELMKEGKDAFRFGNPEWSSDVAENLGNQVIGFARNGRSFTRSIDKTESGYSIRGFSVTLPTPGKRNN